MKKIILILSLAFGAVAYSQKGEITAYPNSEIYRYLKPFADNSSYYIGKPFSVLLNDLVQYKPLSIIPGGTPKDKFVSPATIFYFTPGGYPYRYSIDMTIVWEKPVLYLDVLNLCKKYNNAFTDEVKNFYANSIIKKIYLGFDTSERHPYFPGTEPILVLPPKGPQSTAPEIPIPIITPSAAK